MSEVRCVLLHGFAGAPESWDPVVELLPPGWRVTRPAVAGHDRSAEWPAGVARFDDEVDRLARVVAEDGGDDRAILGGYSLGGRLALGLLARHPGRWRGALVIGAHPGLPEAGLPEFGLPVAGRPEGGLVEGAVEAAARAARVAADERWARSIETDLDGFVDQWARLPLFATQRAAAPAVLAAQQRIRRRHHRQTLARAMRVLSLGAMPDRLPALAGNRVPLVAMAGALDEKFSGLVVRMAERIPHARAVLVPGAGHNVPLEAPAAVAAALAELAGDD